MGGAEHLQGVLRGARRSRVDGLYDTDALRLALPWLIDHVEETWRVFGKDFWAYGVEPNRPTWEAIGRYVHEQGLAPRVVTPEETVPGRGRLKSMSASRGACERERPMTDLNNRPGGPNLIVTAKTAHKVHFLDAATLTMTATIDMPGSTHELALSPDGRTAYGIGLWRRRVRQARQSRTAASW